MILKEQYVSIIITALEDDLVKLKSATAFNEWATDECIKVSSEILDGLRNGILELDSAAIGYVDTTLFNYMPKNIEEYQALVNVFSYMHKNTADVVYPVESLEDLEKGFEWAKEEGRGIKLVTTFNTHNDDDSIKSDVVIIHNSNLESRFKHYRTQQALSMIGGNGNGRFRVIGYSLD